jgi:predicted  nucleic acid-binding Zn-ribbon protein
MSSPFHLYQLQKIDSQVDQTSRRVKEIQNLISFDEKSNAISTELQGIESELEAIKFQADQTEKTINQRKIKLEQANSALYGGKVHIPKELVDLQAEIESHKNAISQMEDEFLKSLDKMEITQTQLSSIKDRLEKSKIDFETLRTQLISENNIAQKNLERLNVERQVATSQISKEMLTIYENIRQKKKGFAVSLISEQACSACGYELTPAEVQKARTSTDLFYCSSCGRILYSE